MKHTAIYIALENQPRNMKNSNEFALFLVISEILGGVPLKQKLSHYELSRFIFQIWEKLKSRKCTYASKLDFVKEKENDECVPVKKNAEANSVSVFSSYMLDHSMFDEGLDCDGIDDVTKYKKIMAETVDILENEDCLTVVFECIKKGLEQLLVNLEPFFLSQEEGKFLC